jgi:ATP-dependent DNA helicase RecQ
MGNKADWAVVLDIDETLVLTSTLEPLRKKRKWGEVYAAFSQTRLPNGTLDFIEKVSRQARLAAATKAPRAYAEKLLAYHGLRVPVVAAYHDVKKVKPDPEALLLASQKLGIEPAHCIYIGDDANDVQAARAAGFTPIGVCWGERIDIGLGSVFTSWDDVYAEILRVISA